MPREVVIDENSGFCFGVINAIRTAEEHLRKHPFLYCLGDIVHNSEEVRRLTSMVLRLQKRIHDEYHTGGNKQILIFGKKGHAEVVGLLGQTDNTGLVISSPEDIERIDFSRPSKLYSQTTQSLERYNELIGLIRTRYEADGHTEWFSYEDTICRKVASRARQIADFATRHNVILFISGEKSSNGMYLYNICREHNPRSYLLSRTEQLREVPIDDNDTVGVCGATSTPMWLMEEIAAACAK